MSLKGKAYFPVKEIGSFSFIQFDRAREFIDRLRDMTAIDMLLLQSHCHNVAK